MQALLTSSAANLPTAFSSAQNQLIDTLISQLTYNLRFEDIGLFDEGHGVHSCFKPQLMARRELYSVAGEGEHAGWR